MSENPQTAIVSTLYAAGFPLGPNPEDPCQHCSHIWGNHLLIASNTGDPLDGGHTECPHVDCRCRTTWSLPTSASATILEYRRRKGVK